MMDAIMKETRGKIALRAMRYKHLPIRETSSLRNRYLHYHPEDAAKLPELSVNVDDRRNMDNLIQDMQFFYGNIPLPRTAESLLDPSVINISGVTKQLLGHLRNENNKLPEVEGGGGLLGSISSYFSLSKARAVPSSAPDTGARPTGA
jgi:hypothetical protein